MLKTSFYVFMNSKGRQIQIELILNEDYEGRDYQPYLTTTLPGSDRDSELIISMIVIILVFL